MVTEAQVFSQDRFEKFSEALEEARRMQQDWMTHGLDFVHLYIEDVEGDWLERWGEDEEALVRETPDSPAVSACQPVVGALAVEAVRAFLESDDSVAVKVRERLTDISLSEMAAQLEKCLSIPEENDQRLFAVKTILADSIITIAQNAAPQAIATNRDSSDENDEISLLNLAEDLLEKLEEIREELAE